jgi:hypothetical protein
MGIYGTNEFSDQRKKTLGSNLPYWGIISTKVVSYSGGYGIHMPANGTNNVSPCLLVRSIRLVVARAFTFRSGYRSG